MTISNPLLSSAGSRVRLVTYATAIRASGSIMTGEPPSLKAPVPGRVTQRSEWRR